MKQKFLKIIGAILIAIFIAQPLALIQPQKAEAQWIVEDPANLIQNTIQAVALTKMTVQSTLLSLK